MGGAEVRSTDGGQVIAPGTRPTRAALWRGLLWIGLGAAGWPVLADLVGLWLQAAWSRYSLAFVPLLVLAAGSERQEVSRSSLGALWVAVGVGQALVASGAGFERYGGPGLALAVFGLCRAFAMARGAVAALAFGVVPLPHFVGAATSPHLEALWSQLSLGIARAVAGTSAETGGSSGLGPLALDAMDTGLPLLVMLGGWGWYRAARRRATLTGLLTEVARWGAVAPLLQALAATAAGVALGLGADPQRASLAIVHLPSAVALAVVATELFRGTRGRRRSRE